MGYVALFGGDPEDQAAIGAAFRFHEMVEWVIARIKAEAKK